MEYAGAEMAVGFNSRYLVDALGAVEGSTAIIELKDALSPGVVKGIGEGRDLCVIMPMRI